MVGGMSPEPPASGGRYGGVSAEDRRSERRTRLLDAAFELLGTDGWRGTTVRAVCEAAKLNPRYFYESFEDLDALLVAVFDRITLEATAEILAAFDAAPVDAGAKSKATIGAFVMHVTDDPRRARVLFAEALGNEALARRRLDAMHAMWALLARYARAFYGRPDDADPIGDVAAALLAGGLAELVIAWLDGRIAVSREQLVEDVAALWVVTGEGAVAIARSRA